MTTAELRERIERLALRDRRFWSKDGQAFRVGDVAYFQAGTGFSSAWIEGRKKPLEITENLNSLETTLIGLFVRCHRSYLVAVDRISAVFERYPEEPGDSDELRVKGSAADECELEMD